MPPENHIQKTLMIFIFFNLMVLLLPVLAHAQPPNFPNPPSAPIDGGLSLLIAGGVGYGIKLSLIHI